MTTQIEVVDINDNTNDNNEVPAVEEVKLAGVKPKAKPRAKAKVKEATETVKPKAQPRAKAKAKINEEVQQEEVEQEKVEQKEVNKEAVQQA